MFCSCFVLSFDACIVTITWSLLFVVIALWVICLTQWITLAPRCSSGLPMSVCLLVFHRLTRKHLALLLDVVSKFKSFIAWWGSIWLYYWTWCLSLNSLVKLCALHRSVIPARVTVLLGLCNPPRRGRGEPAKPGCCISLCGFLAVTHLVSYWGREAELAA
jgi:hypothetical protein